MTERDDQELLRDYARNGSEEAFSALVGRYVNLVYSAALRYTGNPDDAQEITQAVFVILARKAAGLRPGTLLGGWLYQTARLTAANFIKGEIRRQRREQEAYMQSTLNEPGVSAWTGIAPLLDEAMGHLGEADRNAVVLRYFQNKSAREAGAAMRTTEAAAHKRTARALEKLRRFFTKRGVVLSAGVIAGALTANSVQAAPAGLGIKILAMTAAKGAAAGGSTLTLVKGVLKLMAWTKAKVVIVGGVVVLLAAWTTAVVEKRIAAKQYVVADQPWSDAGAATPRAALESLAWALTQGNVDRAQELVQWDEKGVQDAEVTPFQQQVHQQAALMAVLAQYLKDIQSFKILSITRAQQPNELTVKIEETYYTNQRRPPIALNVKLRREGRRWRAVGELQYSKTGESMNLPFSGAF